LRRSPASAARCAPRVAYGILPKGERERHGGVKWTIKNGIVYDAQALLREAEWYVERERRREGTVATQVDH
jgi:hypothetical protein